MTSITPERMAEIRGHVTAYTDGIPADWVAAADADDLLAEVDRLRPVADAYAQLLDTLGTMLRTHPHPTGCPYNYRYPNNRAHCTCWQAAIRYRLPDPYRPGAGE